MATKFEMQARTILYNPVQSLYNLCTRVAQLNTSNLLFIQCCLFKKFQFFFFQKFFFFKIQVVRVHLRHMNNVLFTRVQRCYRGRVTLNWNVIVEMMQQQASGLWVIWVPDIAGHGLVVFRRQLQSRYFQEQEKTPLILNKSGIIDKHMI